MATISPSTGNTLPSLFDSSSGRTSEFAPKEEIPADVKVATRGIDPSSTAKNTSTQVSVSEAQPVSGQVNETPTDSDLSSSDFDIDAYRNGTGDETDPEIFAPRTLADSSEDDEELASISVKTNLRDDETTTTYVNAYSRFFLQSVMEAEQEKYQIVETFAGFYAFFFGKRPPIYRYTGVLLSDKNYRWNNDFKFMYENYFRGTSSVTLQSEVILTYDGRMVVGFPLSLSMQQDSANPKGTPFAMDVLVVSHTPLNFSRDVASLIASRQAALEKIREEINSIAKLSAASSGSTLISDQVTNGVKSGVSIDIPGVDRVALPTDQLKV